MRLLLYLLEMRWTLSSRGDKRALGLADRHYNRQKPGTSQFVPPGRCVVLLEKTGKALWVTSWPFAEYTKHEWAGAWVCSCFRYEPILTRNGAPKGPRASVLIRQAVAVTVWRWPVIPELGMVTFVNPEKVKTEVLGRCYLEAGFRVCGETKGGLLALQLLPCDMPAPEAPWDAQLVVGFEG